MALNYSLTGYVFQCNPLVSVVRIFSGTQNVSYITYAYVKKMFSHIHKNKSN